MLKIITLCLFLLGSGALLTSRGQALDTAYRAPGLQYALALYDSTTLESQHLFNGPQYYFYDSKSDEHQFYQSKNWKTGSVFYDGQLFSSVPILYDIVRDQVVIKYIRNYGVLSLQNEKIRYFQLPGEDASLHTFVRVQAQRGDSTGLRTGFYDQLYAGTSKVLARRVKERLQEITESKIIIHFPYRESFYVLKQGVYHPVSTRRSALALLGDQKKSLRSYIREHKLNFKDNREAAIVALVTYYDQLTQL
jgi:hypothetical protein